MEFGDFLVLLSAFFWSAQVLMSHAVTAGQSGAAGILPVYGVFGSLPRYRLLLRDRRLSRILRGRHTDFVRRGALGGYRLYFAGRGAAGSQRRMPPSS